jgi:hypothetical protein
MTASLQHRKICLNAVFDAADSATAVTLSRSRQGRRYRRSVPTTGSDLLAYLCHQTIARDASDSEIENSKLEIVVMGSFDGPPAGSH